MINTLQNNFKKLEKKNYSIVRKNGPEGVLFLKKNNDFPIKSKDIALYGPGIRYTTICGTGGGVVNVKKIPTIEEAFLRQKYNILSIDWLDSYDNILNTEKDKFFKNCQGIVKDKGFAGLGDVNGRHFNEPAYEININKLCDNAIYVLTRLSGEGVDRTATQGDFYLTNTEINDIKKLAKIYPKFMLVLNTSGFVDLSPIIDDVSNILYLSQPGIATGDILVDIISGKSYPSGKLSLTYAKYSDYQTIGNFGDKDDTDYKEGIYVGYRYFDSANITPMFPFGFGLSYTDFKIETQELFINKSIVTIKVIVTNIGNFKGKEVVQVYVSVPSGKLDEPYQSLIAFKKTKELKPSEKEELTISFDFKDLRTFDYESSARILEKGDYIVRVGNSSRNTTPIHIIRLNETVISEKVSHVGGNPDFKDYNPNYVNTDKYDLKITTINPKDLICKKIKKYKVSKSSLELAKSLNDDELANLLKGGYLNEGYDNPPHVVGIQVAGQVGMTTYLLENKGLKSIPMADGPAGLHISNEYYEDEYGVYPKESAQNLEFKELVGEKIYEVIKATYPEFNTKGRNGVLKEHNATNIPIGMSLAQTWNTNLAYKYGKLIASELEAYGIHSWFGPGVNICRHVLCGRVYEYLSEDPILTGLMASEIVKGSKINKYYSGTPKHFCCNNQETARPNNSSNVSERALRDIYVRGFEIIIKKANPYAIMASYNLLNGVHTCERYDLMETLLRDEFGFKGLVMTDWLGPEEPEGFKYQRFKAHQVIKAGCDIMMPGCKIDRERIKKALDEGYITHDEAVRNASRIIEYVRKLGGLYYIKSSRK